jgi:hypothetical protein
MRRQTGRIHPAIVAAVVVSTLAACADKPLEWTYAPPPASVREQLGAVAVVPVACDAAYSVPTPAQGGGAGASAGAGQGALLGAAPGAGLCYLTGPFCLITGLPIGVAGGLVGALAGSAVGAQKAHSAEEVTAAETVLRQIMTSTPADERLADLIVAKAGESGIAARVERADKGALPDDLEKKGFTSTLLIKLPIFILISKDEIEPSVRLIIGVDVKLENIWQPTSIWSRSWLYRHADQPFFDLASNDGVHLREDINTGLSLVATKVVADVFVAGSPESYPHPAIFSDVPPGVVRPVLSCDRLREYGTQGGR